MSATRFFKGWRSYGSAKRSLLGAAFVVSFGVLWAFFQLRSPIPKQEEMPVSALTLRAGRLCYGQSQKPFSGVMVDRYPGGQTKLRAPVAQGLPEGLSIGWHTNGQQQFAEFFRKGVSDGWRIQWYANGTKMSETRIANGKLNGAFRKWDEQGRLLQEVELKDGEPDGLSREYYPSGSVRVEALMKAGQLIDRKTWKDGERILAALARERAEP
ncbi:MAG: toxin-antitoxin system YwqK family antitoxin [Verrucomicrobiia bacterium]